MLRPSPTCKFPEKKGVSNKILLAIEHLLQVFMPTMTADMNSWSPETCRTYAWAFADLQLV